MIYWRKCLLYLVNVFVLEFISLCLVCLSYIKDYNNECFNISFNFQASTLSSLTFVRLSCTCENWRQTNRSCTTVVRRDKWKNDCSSFWRLHFVFSIIKICCFVILTDFNFVNNYSNVGKAFDVVPHIRLLRKLEHYGIKGKILEWMRAWFTQRQQCVVVEGETSGKAHV